MSVRTLPRQTELPRALYTAEQVRRFDQLAIERHGVTGDTLMQRAGQAAFEALLARWPQARRILVLAGTGNNGGDGLVIARLAREHGLEASVLQLGDRTQLAPDAALQAERWVAAGGHWGDFEHRLPRADVLVDALLGTGLSRPVAGRYADAIGEINRHPAPCLAVDVPSGLNADSGEVMGSAVRAALTVSFIGLKRGLFTADGPDCAGEIVFDGLGVPAVVYGSTVLSARRLDWAKQSALLPRRRRNSHKGHFGHVLVVGGNHGFGGAGLLAAAAALRTGAGLVSLATRPRHVGAALARWPEVMVHGIDEEDELGRLLRQASVIVLGPGLGRDAWATGLYRQVMETDRPLVVDADALHGLAAAPQRRDNWVLTPHPGEAAVLLGVCTAEIVADRFGSVEALQRRYGGGVVLKGAGSLVASDGPGPLALCSEGNPGMASGGMGDVLSGVIAGLLAQGLTLDEAAECGVCLHAAAGDSAARDGERGLVASDLIDALRGLVNPGRGSAR
jgi:NAD(P)H-hydrate epimerase